MDSEVDLIADYFEEKVSFFIFPYYFNVSSTKTPMQKW